MKKTKIILCIMALWLISTIIGITKAQSLLTLTIGAGTIDCYHPGNISLGTTGTSFAPSAIGPNHTWDVATYTGFGCMDALADGMGRTYSMKWSTTLGEKLQDIYVDTKVIPRTAVEIEVSATPTIADVNGSTNTNCTLGSSVQTTENLSNGIVLLGRAAANADYPCEIYLPAANVDVTVTVPAGTPKGSYQGTIVLTQA